LSPLDEIVHDGARQMLAALQAEVAAYVEPFRDEVDEAGSRWVVRSGYHAPPHRVRPGSQARRERSAPGCAGPRVRNSRTARSSNGPTHQEVTLEPRDMPLNRS
jgi:hypothetical protein